jgi:hypothetical protein
MAPKKMGKMEISQSFFFSTFSISIDLVAFSKAKPPHPESPSSQNSSTGTDCNEYEGFTSHMFPKSLGVLPLNESDPYIESYSFGVSRSSLLLDLIHRPSRFLRSRL